MSFFTDNKSKIINNLMISNKLYYVANYLDSQETNEPDGTIKITIKTKAYAMNNSGKETSASASLSGSTNTTNGIGFFYVSLLGDAVNLIYKTLSTKPGFENCNSKTSIYIDNPLNVISLVSIDTMKFQFDILNLKVPRQEGQTVNALIKYQYVKDFDVFDYKNLRSFVIDVLESTVDKNTYWENLCLYIAHKAIKLFPQICGIKIELIILSNPNGQMSEPGNHGPTYTYGYYLE
jgi:hypothetical protein